MRENTANKLAKHPKVRKVRYVEPKVYEFFLKPGNYFYDAEANRIDELGDVCFTSFITATREEFEQYTKLIIDEPTRAGLGLSIRGLDTAKSEEFLQTIREIIRRAKKNGDWFPGHPFK